MNHLIFAPYCVRVTSSVTTRTDIAGQKSDAKTVHCVRKSLLSQSLQKSFFIIALKEHTFQMKLMVVICNHYWVLFSFRFQTSQTDKTDIKTIRDYWLQSHHIRVYHVDRHNWLCWDLGVHVLTEDILTRCPGCTEGLALIQISISSYIFHIDTKKLNEEGNITSSFKRHKLSAALPRSRGY